MFTRSLVLFAGLTLLASHQSIAAEDASNAPSNQELYEIIQAQQEALDALKKEEKITLTGDSKTSIGGYGELHYNNFDEAGSKMDYHRFVLYFAHEFSSKIRFFSELEVEHSLVGEGKPGEVELEQAYIEFDLADDMRVKGGLFLVPVGIINETHEPPTFYGVERNPIESNIIPATWWEAGAAMSGNFGASGLSYDLAVTSGLNTTAYNDDGSINAGSSFNIRSGRQKVANAVAEDLAYSGRLKYTGVAGLELAVSVVHQSDISQGLVVDAGAATLLETHARWNKGPLTLTALYAGWSIDGDAAELAEKDQQDGYFVEGSWRFNPSFGVFLRHNEWDNGGAGDTEKSQSNLGFNYWPHRNVVIKFDIEERGKSQDDNGFNLGIGYQF